MLSSPPFPFSLNAEMLVSSPLPVGNIARIRGGLVRMTFDTGGIQVLRRVLSAFGMAADVICFPTVRVFENVNPAFADVTGEIDPAGAGRPAVRVETDAAGSGGIAGEGHTYKSFRSLSLIHI